MWTFPLAAFHTTGNHKPAVKNPISLFIFLLWCTKQQAAFDQHVIWRRKGTPGTKEQLIGMRKGKMHIWTTRTIAMHGIMFFLTIFSNNSMTFVLQNGIVCCKHSMSWGLSVFFCRIWSCAYMDLCTTLTGGKRNRTKTKTLQGKLVTKEMWSF